MRQVLYSFLLLAAIAVSSSSCSNGDYSANASNPANGSINPLNPLTASQFTWTGTGKFSAAINGTPWVADSAVYFISPGGKNVVWAFRDSMREQFYLYLINPWQGNLFNMGFHQYNTFGFYTKVDSPISRTYFSYLGNSGELNMQQNDTLVFQGRFYFQAVDTAGNALNISNGYFNLNKY